MHIALIGEMATGKTTIATILRDEFPELHYLYMAQFAVLIPMALQQTTHPNILRVSKEAYIAAIVANQEISTVDVPREDLNRFAWNAIAQYGPSIFAETGYAVIPQGKFGLFDSCASPEGVEFLKKQGTYVIGLRCTLDTQVQRRLNDPRSIDPTERTELEHLIRETEQLVETRESFHFADVIYDTEKYTPPEIVHEIACVLEN